MRFIAEESEKRLNFPLQMCILEKSSDKGARPVIRERLANVFERE